MELTKEELFSVSEALLTRMGFCTDKMLARPVSDEDHAYWHREHDKASALFRKVWDAYQGDYISKRKEAERNLRGV
jgi:hypothetical protein